MDSVRTATGNSATGDSAEEGASEASPLTQPVVEDELVRELVRPGPRYTSYPTAPAWNDAFGDQQYAERLALADSSQPDTPLSLYIHLPFCREMCRYCGCNVVVTMRRDKIDHYIDYLAREMDLVLQHLPRRRRVDQLHLGGGTPTWLDGEQLERLWREVTARFEISDRADLALEADPRVTTTEQLSLLRRMGFSRLSMGVQDFTPEVQEHIGRHQSVEQTERLFRHAREVGYRTINFDLVYGLPAQRQETFRQTLAEVRRMRPDRLALFSYAHVPWMRPHQRTIDVGLLPDPVTKLRLFEMARAELVNEGYVTIGMDHFALPDDELARGRLSRRLHRNFQGYITRPSGDTVAFGITAISDVQRSYAQNVKKIADYYRILDDGRMPIERGCLLSDDDVLRRDVIHRIMCNFIIDLEQVSREHGADPEVFAGAVESLEWAEQHGLLHRRGWVLEVPPRGQLFVRNIAMAFDAYLPAQQSKPTFSSTV